jgi:hypothetical protein
MYSLPRPKLWVRQSWKHLTDASSELQLASLSTRSQFPIINANGLQTLRFDRRRHGASCRRRRVPRPLRSYCHGSIVGITSRQCAREAYLAPSAHLVRIPSVHHPEPGSQRPAVQLCARHHGRPACCREPQLKRALADWWFACLETARDYSWLVLPP